MPDQNFEVSTGQQPVRFEGLEFVELATTDAAALDSFLQQLGFVPAARHRSKEVTLYRQGQINLIVNATPGSQAEAFAQQQGVAVCALALRTADATSAYQNLLARGAWEAQTSVGAMELNIPAIETIGGTQLYLVDRYGDQISIYDIDFKALPSDDNTANHDSMTHADSGLGLQTLDRLTLEVPAARVPAWRDFFIQLFGFKPTTAERIELEDHFGLQFESHDNPVDQSSLDSERISALHFRCADPDRTRDRFSAQGLQLKALAEDSGHGAWEVESPLEHLAVRFIFSA